jgi:transcriptional regulator PpsR
MEASRRGDPAASGKGTSLERLMAGFDASNAAMILSAAADITFVVNAEGIVSDRVMTSPEMPEELFIGWPGKALVDLVTLESRPKIEQMLRDVAIGAPGRWRQVNHPTGSSEDLPVRYFAMRSGTAGHAVLVGRDMRHLAAMQQRLLAAEQSIEQEYARLRHAETRYRLLMQVASEAILVVEARTGRIVEANPAAASLLNKPVKRLQGAVFQDMFDGTDAERIEGLMMSLRSTGRADDVALTLQGLPQQAVASSSVFRQENASYFLIRLQPLATGAGGIVVPRAQSAVLKIIQDLPDAFVVTDADRRVLIANSAFLDSAQLGSEEQARGEPLDRWLGRAGVDTNLLFNSLAEKGSIRQFQTVVRGQFGTSEDVEVSGVAALDAQPPCYGFSIRRVGRRPVETDGGRRSMLRSVDEMTKLVGKVPLRDLVRETTDIIERLCIEAALQINDNNRAGAADMLGLSRQSLYVKLHRYGIEDKSSGNEN